MSRVLRSLSLVFTVGGWLALPVSIVWLMVLAQWWALAVVVVSFAAPFVLAIALLPGLALGAAAVKVAARRRAAGLVIAFTGLLYVAALITVWCMGVFTFLVHRATPATMVPLLLLAFSVGSGPWKYMARRQLREGRRGELVQTFFLQLALLVVISSFVLFRPDSVMPLWWLFAGVMMVEAVVYVWPVFGAKRDSAVPDSPRVL